MRILLDESLPRRLRREFTGHSVSTVADCGWSGISNGELLELAAARFDAFVTADQNLQYQQNLAALPIRVVLLIARDNRFETLTSLIPQLLLRLETAPPRSLLCVGR
jgi:predicted nuclease of predicted toxin-antitoxin system